MGESRIVQELMGAPGSPYTRKMLGLMRYRHIPYRLERQSRIPNSSEEKHRRKRVEPKEGEVRLRLHLCTHSLIRAHERARARTNIKVRE